MYNVGQQIVSRVMLDGTPKPFLDRGWNRAWVQDPANILRLAVFQGTDMDAWQFILRNWETHGKIPGDSRFRAQFPQYELLSKPDSVTELLEAGGKQIQLVATQDAMGDLMAYQDAEQWDLFASRAQDLAHVLTHQNLARDTEILWDNPDVTDDEIEARINRKVKKGILTGIEGIDRQKGFFGFGPGDFVTYLGRAKAGKTSFALLTALHAWEHQYKRVLVVTFEITADDFRDRLDSYLAKINLNHLRHGEMDPAEKKRFRDSYIDRREFESSFFIVQPGGDYTVSDLEAHIDKYQPDLVIVDGFYFMIDRNSGHTGGEWEGHDGLSTDLKNVALRRQIVVMVTHQIREKQSKGVETYAMMGGTHLTMASTYVFAIDINDGQENIIKVDRSRNGYLDPIKGYWDWNTCEFFALDWTEDPDAEA